MVISIVNHKSSTHKCIGLSSCKYLIVLLLLFMLLACKDGKHPVSDASSTSYLSLLHPDHVVRPDSIWSFIHANCLDAAYTTPWDSAIHNYYSGKNDFLWLRSGGRQFTDTLIYYLDHLYRHGLDAELFSLSKIKAEAQKLKSLRFADGETVNHSLANLEYLLTRSYMYYLCGMSYGFVTPYAILNTMEAEDNSGESTGNKKMKTLYQIPLKACTREFAEQALAGLKKGDAINALREIQPSALIYRKIQEEVDRFTALGDVKFDPIPEIGNTLLKQGDSHSIVPLITRRLLATGELEVQSADTTGQVLTPVLLQAINKVRVQNRLPEDSTLGTFTIRYLNHPVRYYTDRLKVNLERLRWQYAQERGKKYVMVNVAAFMLQAVNEETDSILEMRICCGSVGNKTPLLLSKIYCMQLNPYWNVPQSIIKKEILPAFRRDTTYFTRHRMKIYDLAGKSLNPHDINWSNQIKKGGIMVKQDNKEGNSLGRIIFRFLNPFSIYMHDTPSRGAFLRTNRGVSHGCIRLERAMDFSFFLLGKPNPILEDRIRVAMGFRACSDEGRKLVQKEGYQDLGYYTLPEKVPLYIDYQTMYLSAEKVLTYCEDTYAYDRALLKAMERLKK